ncbi:MAG: DUF4136 domain-containing protein [Desulfofustis sp.]
MIRTTLALLLLTLLAGCSRVQTSSEIDAGTDFAGLKTYAWLTDEEPKAEDIRLNDPRIGTIVRDAVDQVLTEKGYTKVEQEEADFLVVWFGAIEKKIKKENIEHFYAPYGYGTLYRDPALRTGASGTAREYEEGTVIIDVLDPRTRDILWRGSGSGRLVEGQQEQIALNNLRRSVKKIVQPFPVR